MLKRARIKPFVAICDGGVGQSYWEAGKIAKAGTFFYSLQGGLQYVRQAGMHATERKCLENNTLAQLG